MADKKKKKRKRKSDRISYCPPKKPSRIGSVLKNQIDEKVVQTDSVSISSPFRASRGRAPDFITGETGFPSSKSITAAEKCSPKGDKGKKLAIKECDLSLQFVSPETAEITSRKVGWGVKPGAYLRMCTEWGGAPLLIPVKDHADAMKKGKKICSCIANKKADKKTCLERGSRNKAKAIYFEKRSAAKKDKKECLRWSKDGKRCLRRAKS